MTEPIILALIGGLLGGGTIVKLSQLLVTYIKDKKQEKRDSQQFINDQFIDVINLLKERIEELENKYTAAMVELELKRAKACLQEEESS